MATRNAKPNADKIRTLASQHARLLPKKKYTGARYERAAAPVHLSLVSGTWYTSATNNKGPWPYVCNQQQWTEAIRLQPTSNGPTRLLYLCNQIKQKTKRLRCYSLRVLLFFRAIFAVAPGHPRERPPRSFASLKTRHENKMFFVLFVCLRPESCHCKGCSCLMNR